MRLIEILRHPNYKHGETKIRREEWFPESHVCWCEKENLWSDEAGPRYEVADFLDWGTDDFVFVDTNNYIMTFEQVYRTGKFFRQYNTNPKFKYIANKSNDGYMVDIYENDRFIETEIWVFRPCEDKWYAIDEAEVKFENR